jgi:hypothetical protein
MTIESSRNRRGGWKRHARTKEELQSASRELRLVLDTREKEIKTRMVLVIYCE